MAKKSSPSAKPRVEVLTNRYGPDRIGTNLDETELNPTNVDVNTFGKLFGRPVDGDLHAQPLIVNDLVIGGGRHASVVFLATSRNTVYAYDAEDPDESLPLWETNLGEVFAPPRLPVPRDAIFPGYLNFHSEVGITSTPVIDIQGKGRAKGGIMYVVAKTVARPASRKVWKDADFAYHIHALDILTGKPAASVAGGKPTEIAATVSSGRVKAVFGARLHLNRPGLLLLNGILYLAFGSHGDVDTFWGWVMAFDARTLAKLAVHCTAIEWGEGGIWQSGNGLAGEKTKAPDGSTHHYVYTVVGNGQRPIIEGQNGGIPTPQPNIPATISEPFYGNSILKLELLPSDEEKVGGRPPTQGEPGTSHRFDIVDWFTTSDCLDLNNLDDDLISGPVLFDFTPEEGTQLPMVLGGGKDGRFYLCDRNSLGRWNTMSGPEAAHVGEQMIRDPVTGQLTDKPRLEMDPKTKEKVTIPEWKPWPPGSTRNNNVLQDDKLCAFHIHGTPVIWKKTEADITAFVWSENDYLRAYPFVAGTKKFDTLAQSTSQYRLPPYELRMPGGFIALSADGDDQGSAVVWASHSTDDDAMNKTVKGTLRAFKALDLNEQLWTSDTESEGQDRLGSLAKFCPPVVANGKVYMSTFSRELVVYGLLPPGKRRKRDCEIFETRVIGSGVTGGCTYSCARYNLGASGRGLVALSKSDSFFFASRELDASKDGVSIEITAQVLGLMASSSLDHACAGLMIRSVGGAGSEHDDTVMPFAAVLATPKDGAFFLCRSEPEGESHRDETSSTMIPYWIRLMAVSNVAGGGLLEFTGSVSADGQAWKTISSKTVIAMQGLVRVGLVGTGASKAAVDQMTDHITVSFGSVTLAPLSP